MIIRRGDIFLLLIRTVSSSEFEKERPWLVVQNNRGNDSSDTITVVYITTTPDKKSYPMHVEISLNDLDIIDKTYPFSPSSIIRVENIFTPRRQHFNRKIAFLKEKAMKYVDKALKHHLALGN